MYKTKVVMYGRCAVIPVGTKLNLSNSGDVFCVENCELIFGRLFVESHPEIFEKVEEMDLAEKLIKDHIGLPLSTTMIDGIPISAFVKAAHKYHKLAGGWTDEDMIDFWRYAIDLNKDELIEVISRRTAVKALALYKRHWVRRNQGADLSK